MNLAIWGTKSEAVYLAEQIKKYSEFNIVCFIDSKIMENYRGEVIHPSQISEKDKIIDAVIVAVRGTHSRLDIIQQLKKINKKIGIFKFSAHDFKKNVIIDRHCNSKYIIWLDQMQKPVIPYLETHIMDSCNLNCKGCTHFSNLYEIDSNVSYEQFMNDINQLSQKCFVIQLRLLGGEPLLNTDCIKI